MIDPTQIRKHMAAIGADGAHLGLVAAVEGDQVRLSATAANAALMEEEADGRPLSDLR